MCELTVRFARPVDAGLILELIRALAAYEESVDLVTATVAEIRTSLFEKNQAEVLIAEVGGEAAAFALFFHNYSTFLGRANLYLEDLFVKERFRGSGVGKALFQRLAEIAAERGCQRLDWLCLDVNEDAADFYRKLGATVIDDRKVFRLSGPKLAALAKAKTI